VIAVLTAVALGRMQSTVLAAFILAFLGWEIFAALGVLPRVTKLGEGVFSSRPVRFAADCSYGVYLLHYPIQVLVAASLVRSGFLDRAVHERLLILLGITLPLTLAAAWCCHRFIEMPGIAMGKRILARRSREGLDVERVEGGDRARALETEAGAGLGDG